MPKRILNVGQCGPDHASISRFLSQHFDCQIDRAHLPHDTLAALQATRYDLVLINRKLDEDYSDGVEIIRQMKADPTLADVPVMLVTNYAEHQDVAVAAGAVRGFGKLEFGKAETVARVKTALGL